MQLAHATPSRRRRKDARPQELLQAALELFTRKGFAATRSEEVAARAGVSKGTLYLYFPSKEELFKAVVRSNLSALIAEGQQVADGHAGASAELLRRLLRAWWLRVGSTRAGGILKVVVAEADNFPELARFYADEVLAPADRLISGTLQRGIRRGEFRAVPVAEATRALLAPMLLLALQRHAAGALGRSGAAADPLAVVDAQLDLALHGLLPPAPPAPARTTGPRRAAAEFVEPRAARAGPRSGRGGTSGSRRS